MTIRISVPLDVKKLIVAFNKFELFVRGYYEILGTSRNTKFNEVYIPNSVFIVENNKWFDASDFDYKFNCNYNGGGPGNLTRFLEKRTNTKIEELEKVIHHNLVVEYDFSEGEINPLSNYFTQDQQLPVSMNKNGKFIFFIGNNTEILSNEVVAKKVSFIVNIMNQMTGNPNEIQDILYIGDESSDEYNYYSKDEIGAFYERYNVIVRFQEFEVWINHLFGIDHHDIKFNESFKDFLNQLGYSLSDEMYNNSIFKFFDRMKARRLNNQLNQHITISNE